MRLLKKQVQRLPVLICNKRLVIIALLFVILILLAGCAKAPDLAAPESTSEITTEVSPVSKTADAVPVSEAVEITPELDTECFPLYEASCTDTQPYVIATESENMSVNEPEPEPEHALESEPAPELVYEPEPEPEPALESEPEPESALESELVGGLCPITEDEIVLLAKVLYRECGGLAWYGDQYGVSYRARQAAVAWCALNRVDEDEFPDTLQEVLTYSYAFAYIEDTPVTDELYMLSADVIARWWAEKQGEENVGRTLPKGYTYFYGDGTENYFRDAYTAPYNTWDWSLPDPYKEA